MNTVDAQWICRTLFQKEFGFSSHFLWDRNEMYYLVAKSDLEDLFTLRGNTWFCGI